MMKKAIPFLLIMLMLFSGCSKKETAEADGSDRVIIALLDSGVSTAAIKGEHLLAGYNYVTDTNETEDNINHGSAVASIFFGCESANVEGMAPEAFLVPLVVTDKIDGTLKGVTPDLLAQAIRDSIDIYHADIINVSLGIHKDDSALREAIEYAAKKNIPVISAVGNDGENGKPFYPAAYDTVLAVGSCDKNGDKSSFTQDGADVLALGEDIILASRNGVPYGIRGTSFATGFVSAYAAKMMLENPDITTEGLYEKIIQINFATISLTSPGKEQ